jgi:hypothetical protein
VLREVRPQRLEELEAQQNQEHTTRSALTCSLEVGRRSDVLDAVRVCVIRSHANCRTITPITKIRKI